VVRGFSPKPGAKAPGYGFFSEININIVFHFPKALKHRAKDYSQKTTSKIFLPTNLIF